MNKVIVPLNAFHHLGVFTKGQEAFFPAIEMAGAFGVEIRRELLTNVQDELAALKNRLREYDFFIVYSAPVELWRRNGSLNEAEMEWVFKEAVCLGASRIKVSLGYYDFTECDMHQLAKFLERWLPNNIRLLIENDQTEHGGNLESLRTFFERAFERKLPIGMTFDTGNWHFVGEDHERALESLTTYVEYIHYKYVENQKGNLVTLPLLEDREESWRKIADVFPSVMLKALEFPLNSADEIAEYIKMVDKQGSESEELV
ncbi:sugar phosphate isomerase/epimerase family protein [Falsibacillus albus]|uniref:sugar phosphate isomerase/epimerase family protein n=1 Tax=Falsibacillus albus TaxID=2478915 RepID=UPI0018F4D2EC|nr:sugar phosphate isomerase/epimerase [Falsibacillus albus]